MASRLCWDPRQGDENLQVQTAMIGWCRFQHVIMGDGISTTVIEDCRKPTDHDLEEQKAGCEWRWFDHTLTLAEFCGALVLPRITHI